MGETAAQLHPSETFNDDITAGSGGVRAGSGGRGLAASHVL